MGQADLAAGGQGAVGLAGLLSEESAAFGGCQERVVDLAVVEGASGDQVVEVAGRLPQLPVAVADRSGGNPSQFLDEGGPRIAVFWGGAGCRKLYRSRGAVRRAALQPRQQHPGTSPGDATRSRSAAHW
jgi:hypothetical protein